MRRLRLLLSLATILVLVATCLPTAQANQWALNSHGLTQANITIDGRPQSFSGYIVNDRTVVPLRAIFEALGADIKWNPDTYTVTATKGSKVIVLTVGQTLGKIDSQDYTLAVPPVLIDSKTFVPVRFIIDALGLDIKWDAATYTVAINTGSGCTLAPFQEHEGYIKPGGETWGKCGSPHVVKGTFRVEGADNPILTLEEGVVVRFAADASIEVGAHAPGGLVVNGKASNPVLFTADSSGPQPGFWSGIRFFNQTLINDSRITGAIFEYAGETENGAVTIEGWEKLVEVQMNEVEFKNNLYAGLVLRYQGRLRQGSANLKVSGTMQAGENGGFPIETGVFGSHNLPRGEFKNNAMNAVHLYEPGSGSATIAANTTWRNLSIPYAIAQNIYVEGKAAPTLTIEPGVISLWAEETSLLVGHNAPGYLVADAVAKPEGSGEWKVEKAELDLGLKLADARSLEPGCTLCGQNRAIVFGAWSASPVRGAWGGIQLRQNSGDKTRLVGVVIAYGGRNEEYSAGLYAESNEGKAVKLLLAKSLISGAARSGLEFWGNVQLRAESTGNFFVQNSWPIRLLPDYIGYLPAGQTFTGNDMQVISVSSTGGSSESVTKSATWRNHGIPYKFDLTVYIGGPTNPVVTIEPGTTLLFQSETGLQVGSSEGMGSLVAVGAAGKPIKFSAEAGRAGAWDGLSFSSNTGSGNRLEMVTIEYATIGVSVEEDLGAFIKNSTIRNTKEMGIYRGWGTEGTSFLTGLGNQFEGNAVDENEG